MLGAPIAANAAVACEVVVVRDGAARGSSVAMGAISCREAVRDAETARAVLRVSRPFEEGVRMAGVSQRVSSAALAAITAV